MRSNRNVKNKPMPKKEDSWVKDRGRWRMDFWVSVVVELSTRIMRYSALSLVVLKLKETGRRLHLHTAYTAGLNDEFGGKQSSSSMERVWDIIGHMDGSYKEVARCVLKDIERVTMGREIPKHEVLKRFHRQLDRDR